MKNFEKRRDRFEFFDSFENPLLNVTFDLEVKNFLPYCKERGLPPFHFFLYCLFISLDKIENFKYRIYQKEVIQIEKFIASYTVINEDNLFNYTRFENSADLKQFIQNSVKAKTEAMKASQLINTGLELTEREIKDYVFITSLPWFRFTSIQHPVFKFKSADIPSIAWGKFIPTDKNKLLIPFSVQAHHGFVDGYHIHLLGELISEKIDELMLIKV